VRALKAYAFIGVGQVEGSRRQATCRARRSRVSPLPPQPHRSCGRRRSSVSVWMSGRARHRWTNSHQSARSLFSSSRSRSTSAPMASDSVFGDGAHLFFASLFAMFQRTSSVAMARTAATETSRCDHRLYGRGQGWRQRVGRVPEAFQQGTRDVDGGPSARAASRCSTTSRCSCASADTATRDLDSAGFV
jgi:hypothetical protein